MVAFKNDLRIATYFVLTFLFLYQGCTILLTYRTLSKHSALSVDHPPQSHAHMHVALVFDFNRVSYAAQVIRSLRHHNPASQFRFHLVTDKPSHAQLELWFHGSSLFEFYDHLMCKDLVAPVFGFSDPAIHVSAHCKAFLADIIQVDRVLYIDTDVTAVGDVTPCFHHSFGGSQYIGMVVDMGDVCQYWPDR